MRFAICNETFQDWPVERGFAFARQCGYQGVEIAPFTLAEDIRRLSPQRREQIRQAAENNQLQVVGLHWLLAKTEGFYLTSPEPQVRQATARYLEELARLCFDLGGQVMVFGSPQQRKLLPGVTHQQALDYAVEVFQRIMPALEENQVVLAVEPLAPSEDDFLTTAEAAEELIDRVDHPHCRLHLDCKAMSSEQVPIPELIRRHKDRLEHFHANDPNLQGPGFGQLDFVPIFKALREVGYRGWVSVEVFDYTPGPERLARESIRYMQQALQEAGG